MAPEKLTEYEQKRLENIRRNDEMMAALKIHSKASQLSADAKRQRVASSKSYKVSPEKKAKSQSPIVIRRSLRTQGISPDSKGLAGDFLEPPNKPPNPISQQKPSPHVLGPLSMRDAYEGTGSDRALIDTILSIGKKPQPSVSIKRDLNGDETVKQELSSGDSCEKSQMGISIEREFNRDDSVTEDRGDEVSCEKPQLDVSIKREFDGYGALKDEQTNKMCDSVNGVVKNEYLDYEIKTEKNVTSVDLGPMSLEPDNIARVVPGRIMVTKFLPRDDVRMIAVGNKFGNVGFWKMDCEGEGEDGIFLYRPHTGPISGILFPQSCLSKIFTSCYDGFVRLMDVEKEVFDLEYSSDDTIFSLSQRPNDMKSLYFGEGRGGLNIWDERTRGFSSHWILHEHRINTIDFNSQNPNIMATSSTDGTACLWDLRIINADKPRSLKIVSHNRAVHSAYFSPSGSSLATASLDDTVGISSGANFEDTSMMYHFNQTGRWLSTFRAIWGWDDSYVFIGNMKRGVDVISPAQRRVIRTLQSPHMSAIPCRFDAHPHKVGMLAGATSGGQVYVWTSN